MHRRISVSYPKPFFAKYFCRALKTWHRFPARHHMENGEASEPKMRAPNGSSTCSRMLPLLTLSVRDSLQDGLFLLLCV